MNAYFSFLGAVILTFLCSVEAGSDETLYGASGYIFNYHADAVDWNEAEFRCPYYNDGRLAIIKDTVINEDVKELIDAWQNRETWIGLLDTYTEEYWHWNDGTKVADYFENWASGEPNDQFGEDCGTYLTPGYQWNDKDCGSRFGFICQMENSEMTALSSTEFVIGDRKTDKSYDGTRDSARQRCDALGYRLAEVTSDNVVSEIMKSPNWKKAASVWVDGKDGCLSGKGKNAVAGSCDGELGYICEAIRPYDLKLSDRRQDFMESETIKIDCTALGLPLPNVTWYKRGAKVQDMLGKRAYQISELGKSTLVIENANIQDTARYRCITENMIDGESRRTKSYTNIRVHQKSTTTVVKGKEQEHGPASRSAKSSRISQDSGDSERGENSVIEACPTELSTVMWMLPAIFAFNILMLLAMGAFLCCKRPSHPSSTKSKDGFTNHAVYSVTTSGLPQA